MGRWSRSVALAVALAGFPAFAQDLSAPGIAFTAGGVAVPICRIGNAEGVGKQLRGVGTPAGICGSATDGALAVVVDAVSKTDCTTGEGSVVTICQYDAAVGGANKWVTAGSVGGVPNDDSVTDPKMGADDFGAFICAGTPESCALDAGIDAVKIGAGGVTNTEYGYIGGLTSDAQTQIEARLPTADAVTIPVSVPNGGSGRATGTTAYSLIATGTTATGAQQTLANGATTEVLVGGGASALPVWTTATGSGAPVRAGSPVLTTPNIGSATGSISGNAGTATVLSANGANCSAGNYPLGVDASGAVEGCTTAGAGDMVLASAQTNTGIKTFAANTLLLSADGDATGEAVRWDQFLPPTAAARTDADSTMVTGTDWVFNSGSTATFSAGATLTAATPIFTGKIDRNNVAVDDDDCTGEQGLYWYDTTDSAFEFCNANSGAPTTLGGGSGDMTLAGTQTVTGPKTFNADTLLLAADADAAGEAVRYEQLAPAFGWSETDEGFTGNNADPWTKSGSNCAWTAASATADANSISQGDINTGGATDGCYNRLGGNLNGFRFGQGVVLFEGRVLLSALADVTNDYVFICGFSDSSTGVPVDGAFFVYDRSVSTNWQVRNIASSTGSEVAGDTPVAAAAATWYKLRVVANAAGTSIAYYLNDVLYATVTSNVPGSTRFTGVICLLAEEAGDIGAVYWQYDYMHASARLTTAR